MVKLRASDGVVLGSFPVADGPNAILFDGENIWVTSDIRNKLTKLRASDGATLFVRDVGDIPRGLAFDGVDVWVSSQLEDTVMRLG